jgi:hypothetical protein
VKLLRIDPVWTHVKLLVRAANASQLCSEKSARGDYTVSILKQLLVLKDSDRFTNISGYVETVDVDIKSNIRLPAGLYEPSGDRSEFYEHGFHFMTFEKRYDAAVIGVTVATWDST